MLDEALAQKIATEAHGDQKYGEKPYTDHLAAVRLVLQDFGYEDEDDICVAAWLHDTLEDTKYTAEEMECSFGPQVTKLVWAVTGIGKTRKERNADAYAKLQQHPAAIPLKLADRISNAENSARDNPRLLAMYRSEYPEFKRHLLGEVSVAARKGPVMSMWDRLDKVLR